MPDDDSHRPGHPAVSVIVPVFDPGQGIDDCIRSLLGQTLSHDDLELIFVDDGSTDGTADRLDALAAEYANVRVTHIPNSGWPGRPRNVGIGMATGKYLFFVDNDDWLERDALEHVHAVAEQDRADIVLGKVVGDGKRVPRQLFERNRHGVPFDDPVLLRMLTPHKLFRRDLLERHGLRFPEGRRRLEDHVFVVSAYFAAERISVLAQRPVYHWVRREGTVVNASFDRFDPVRYFADVREVLDIVEANTEPGPWRDTLSAHWYRGKMLNRVGGRRWTRREAKWRRELFEEVRKLALERYDESVHDHLAFNLRMRSVLLRAGDYEGLESLSRFETRLQSRHRVRGIVHGGTHLVLQLESRLGVERARLRFERRGERVIWIPGEALQRKIPEDERDATGLLRRATVTVWLRNVVNGVEYSLPARTRVAIDRGAAPGRVRPRLITTVPIAPTAAAAGGPLPPGTWEVRAEVSVAGFSATSTVERREEPLLATTYPPGRIVVGDAPPPAPGAAVRAYRRLPWPAIATLKRARAVAARRG